MAIVLTDQAALAVTASFVDRMRMCLVDYSINVLADVINDSPITTSSHALRLALARRILSNPMGYGEIIAFSLVADGTLTDASTDTNITTQVGLLYTKLAELF